MQRTGLQDHPTADLGWERSETIVSAAPPARHSLPSRRCGALPLTGGGIRWRVWAPRAREVQLVLIDGDQRREHPLEQEGNGYFAHTEPEVPEGQQYAYRLGGGPERPDPCSLWQPGSVHGPSAVVLTDHFAWTDQAWGGVARPDLVFYELHVGAFTSEGTFEAIVPRLHQLKELGVTAVELMPVAQFAGNRNWGYDGVLPYATQNSYGGPRGLHRLVDACHAAGLAVILDVVYNHLGPEGNYLPEFGPYFTDRYRTPWGQAINYDGAGCDPVRDYVLDNARMWLEEFHLDGLRLDAVHAIFDLGARHLLQAIKQVAQEVEERTGWPRHIIAESDLNDPRLLRSPERGGYGLDAQWADDFHHAVHALITSERQGYYADFGEAEQLARVLVQPYVYAWDYSPHRGRKHGAPPDDDLGGDRFVVCIQNHDQVGNRARGDRLGTLLPEPAPQRLEACLLLLSPYLPLLFMGEEYGEKNPFPFFCSFEDPQLVEAVRRGRHEEFAAFSWQGEVPDPQGETTFASARLSWSWPEGTHHAGLRRLYADMLAVRKEWPALRDYSTRSAQLRGEQGQPVLEMIRGIGGAAGTIRALFNLTGQVQPMPAGPFRDQKVLFRSESTRYGGSRSSLQGNDLLPWECVVFGPEAWRSLG